MPLVFFVVQGGKMNLPENDYQILKLTDANETMLHQKEFKRRYEYSSLRYFHKEMGL